MTRDDLATYLDDQLGALAAEAAGAAAEPVDPIDDYRSAIDQALRALGTAESSLATATVAQGNVGDYLALGEYYALVLLCRRLATRADVTVGDVHKRAHQIAAQAALLRDQALAEITRRGYGPHTLAVGRITLDSVEPRGATDY
jgi:hypothetical protein